MKTTRHDEGRDTDWLVRLAIPASFWVLLFAFFAVGGWVSLHEPTQTADAESSVPIISDTAAQLTIAPGPAGTADADVPDPAVREFEALDPIGAGHTP